MSNMMQMFVEQELGKQIKENYPHMQYPPCMYARVVGMKEVSGQYECTLKILDKNRQPDSRFPEIPKAVTDVTVTEGEIVVVVLLYGECCPYIMGRCY